MKYHEFTSRKYAGSGKESKSWVTIATGKDLPLFIIRLNCPKRGFSKAEFSIDLINPASESWHL